MDTNNIFFEEDETYKIGEIHNGVGIIPAMNREEIFDTILNKLKLDGSEEVLAGTMIGEIIDVLKEEGLIHYSEIIGGMNV